VALMETNRGCPYKCSFCYWGGSVGQRVRAFSRERLRAELELFGRLKVHTIVLCDANFGLLRDDVRFVEDLIEIRDRLGFPRALETSWAKNKSKAFYEIVRMMRRTGMRSSFTLALQTLSDPALTAMNRRNMKVNEWEDLARWLGREGLDCYAELIWGGPGETVESFMDGYDRLSRHVSRIAAYPLLLLPNTDYAEKKQEYGIVSVRGDADDFEYVLAHHTMSMVDNQRMQRFLFWARVMAENAVLRHTWLGLRELGGLSQSQALQRLSGWMESTDDPAALPLAATLARSLGAPGELGEALSYLFGDPAAKQLLRRWWRESIRPVLPPERVAVLDDIFDYDLLTQPVYHHPEAGTRAEELPVVRLGGQEYFLRAGVPLHYDVPGILAALRAGAPPDLEPARSTVDLYYPVGAEQTVTSTNHETIMHFMGTVLDAVTVAHSPDGVPATDPARALIADRGGCA
jgi:radical SAM C-methyltransferase